MAELTSLTGGLLLGITVAAVFLLALLAGVSVLAGLPKLRRTTRRGFTRSLDELVGQASRAGYLPPDAPRGPVDQLRPAELAATPSRPIRR
jgi:hypothetical protein